MFSHSNLVLCKHSLNFFFGFLVSNLASNLVQVLILRAIRRGGCCQIEIDLSCKHIFGVSLKFDEIET